MGSPAYTTTQDLTATHRTDAGALTPPARLFAACRRSGTAATPGLIKLRSAGSGPARRGTLFSGARA